MTDLLDLLEAQTCMMLPHFSTACGTSLLDLPEGGRRTWTLTTSDTTCPDCLRAGKAHGGLAEWCTAISYNQAAVR